LKPVLPFVDTVREQRVRKAFAVKRQALTPPSVIQPDAASDNVIQPMPRRPQVKSEPRDDFGLIPAYVEDTPHVSLVRTLARLLVWIRVFGGFFVGTAWASLRRRDSERARAIRLRRAFEQAGGTLIKIGQQLSIRLDLLPIAYCQELSVMLDQVPPFPVDEAIAVIERATGRRLSDLFAAFDPEPIGSASVACVYQAVMREKGEKVAVKVRRPHIRELFEADFKVIDLLTEIAEWLTITRPGFAANLRQEFRSSLASELDFRREGRLQELFRRRARKSKRNFFTAPKVYQDYSNHEVLVQEFISGMWLSEVLAAVEQGDDAALARMRELNLDPWKLASRLLYVNNWGLFDHLAFHADPHPANIVVQANNRLVFIDFGACGYLNQPRRLSYLQVHAAYARNDPYKMAKSSIVSVEPFPPIDVNAVLNDLESVYEDQLLMIKSKHSHWYERTTANSWLGSLAVMSKYNIPAPMDVLMFARATLLYDTLAARLNPKINFYREYQRFGIDAQKQARKRVIKATQRRLAYGFSGTDVEAMANLSRTGNDLLYRVQRLFAAPYDFTMVSYGIEKWVFTLIMLIRLAVRIMLLTVAGMAVGMIGLWLNAEPVKLDLIFNQTLNNHLFRLGVVILVLVHLRLLWFRLGDRARQD